MLRLVIITFLKQATGAVEQRLQRVPFGASLDRQNSFNIQPNPFEYHSALLVSH
jgi:hypothetical protein